MHYMYYVMKRYCQTLTLVDNADLIRNYCEAHAHVWPEIVAGQHEVGILEMQIYRKDAKLFMVIDTVDDFDFQRDMRRLAQLPRQAEWESYVSQFQGCDPNAASSEKWHLMDKIFDSNDAAYAKIPQRKKVFVSGCYDLLHSGHVEFFRQAASLGDLYVGIGSDETILNYKHHKPLYNETERLFMVKAVRYVKDAFINQGSGVMDFVPTVEALNPDILVVNADGASSEKERFCQSRGMEYIVLQRTPYQGLTARSSTALKDSLIPTRIDLAGTWIDQPYVSQFCPGWAITLSLEPTFTIRERCGLATSTRNQIKHIWPKGLPQMDPEMLARIVFCFENHPEREDGIISGAQDAIGICVPGLCRHYYNNCYWPERIETCNDEEVLSWLEAHLCLVAMEPRSAGCSVVEGKRIDVSGVRALTQAAEQCWHAILNCKLEAFAAAYRASFEAQVAMFPQMIQGRVQEHIDHYTDYSDVLAYKMAGAGGGGYLALVVRDVVAFCLNHSEAIPIVVRRR